MAQLPSGRHVAIQATPLFALIDAACTPEAISTRLLQIERRHLYTLIDQLEIQTD